MQETLFEFVDKLIILMFSLDQKVVNRLGSFKTPLLIKSLTKNLQYFQLLITIVLDLFHGFKDLAGQSSR